MDQNWLSFKFITRAKAIFWARLSIVILFLVVFVVREWAHFLGVDSIWGVSFFIFVLIYTLLFAYSIFFNKKEVVITYISLLLDLPFLVYLIIYTGGLRSPFFFLQLLYTMFFALLFTRPIAIVPPLMLLPIIAHIDQLVFIRGLVVQDVLILIMYALTNLLLLYSIVYFNTQENIQHDEIFRLKDMMKEFELSEERLRLSREIHDGIGATLSAILMQIDFILSQDDAVSIKKETEELRNMAEEGMEELRRAVTLLRSDFDLKNMLSNMIDRLRSRNDFDVSSEILLDETDLRPDELLAIFRIVQEALTNIVRHSRAKNVRVSISIKKGDFDIMIQDDGKGFNLSNLPENHYGITNMRERARLIGAELYIESEEGKGTKVILKRGSRDGN
ncbi:MAG: sensor histidine kinase [Myxococcota bacterium]